MADSVDYKKQYHLKQMELDSLLEITEAINNNLPERALYKIYDFTIRANLNIEKYALYVYESNWEAKVSYGCTVDLTQTGSIPKELTEIRKITELNGVPEPFDRSG